MLIYRFADVKYRMIFALVNKILAGMSMIKKMETEMPACISQCGEQQPTTCTELNAFFAVGGCASSCSADEQALLQIMAFGCGSCMPTPSPTNAMTTPASTPSPTNAMTTPAPTQPPTHFVGSSVSVGFKVKNVDFTKMTETNKDSMKKGVITWLWDCLRPFGVLFNEYIYIYMYIFI